MSQDRPPAPGAAPAKDRQARALLTAGHLALVLKNLSSLIEHSATQGSEMSRALAALAKTLKRHGHLELSDAVKRFSIADSPIPRGRKRTHRSTLDDRDVDAMTIEQLKAVIHDPAMTRPDLVLVAGRRLGIPPSRLHRLSKAGITKAVETVIRNSEALDIISQEASRAGAQRSS